VRRFYRRRTHTSFLLGEYKMTKSIKTTAVATINNQRIIIFEKDGEKRVAIKPICDAVGVDLTSELQKLKADPILGPTVSTITIAVADGKQREIATISPLFILGWVFNIETDKKDPSAQAKLNRWKLECYNALYHYEFKNL